MGVPHTRPGPVQIQVRQSAVLTRRFVPLVTVSVSSTSERMDGMRARVWAAVSFALVAWLLWASFVPVLAQDQPDGADAGSGTSYLPAVRKQPPPACYCVYDAASLPAAGAIIPNEYIVVLEDAAVRAEAGDVRAADVFAADVLQRYGGELLYTYDASIDGFAARLSPEGAAALAENPSVALVEPNRVVRVEPAPPVAEADVAARTARAAEAIAAHYSWGLDRIDQRDLPLNWGFAPASNGAGVHVYVIDTGVRTSHNEFTARVWTGYSTVADGNGVLDCYGHGTHVAATIAGNTVGVARAAYVHPVRVLDACGSGSDAGVIAGIDWVTKNAIKPAVANMSLGGTSSAALDAAVQKSILSGVTYVVAAGNDHLNACFGSPSEVPAAITVGAITRGDWRSDYSNFGTCVDIFAPGSEILSAWNTSDAAYEVLDGTSMATPHVAGVAATYLATKPKATPAQVAAVLASGATTGRLSAIDVGSPNRLLYTRFTASTPFACTDILSNGGFESGSTVWSQSSSHGYTSICSDGTCAPTIPPRTGAFLAWLAGDDSEKSSIKQRVTLPAGQNAMLSYWYTTYSLDDCGNDFGGVEIKVGSKVVRSWSYDLCYDTGDGLWHNDSIDLSDLAGETVDVIFFGRTDNSFFSNFWVDDARLRVGAVCGVVAAEEEAPGNPPDNTLESAGKAR